MIYMIAVCERNTVKCIIFHPFIKNNYNVKFQEPNMKVVIKLLSKLIVSVNATVLCKFGQLSFAQDASLY